MMWVLKIPGHPFDILGFLPGMLDESDPRPAREQIAEGYVGGWHSFKGFAMLANGDMKFPGDPATPLWAELKFRDEIIRVYEHAWVAIVQADGSFDVARLD